MDERKLITRAFLIDEQTDRRIRLAAALAGVSMSDWLRAVIAERLAQNAEVGQVARREDE
jgi:predicted HicB family RNase H-like nuclease